MKIISNTAISLDAKITASLDQPPNFTSHTDQERMRLIRNMCDAVLTGGNTFRACPYPALAENGKQLLNVILSRSLELPLNEAFLQEPKIARLVLTPSPPPKDFLIEAISSQGTPITPQWIVEQLKLRGIKTLLLEGGGNVLFQFLYAGLLDEMFVTLCPIVIGSDQAPTFFAGHEKLEKRFVLASCEHIGQELFLHYKSNK